MLIFPAIDLYEKKAVRLYQGDYRQMTVYSEHPAELAAEFQRCGASCIHLVDLEGARDGTTPNLDVVTEIVSKTDLFTEIGGGIRNMETVEQYLSLGVDRVILGTAAVTDRAFLMEAVGRYGDRIAVGVDLRDGYVAIKGWTEQSGLLAMDFCRELASLSVKHLICTDISRDGAMKGSNHALYETLSAIPGIAITASGGVSTLEDVRQLKALSLYGAIIGKAYYTGAVDLREAIRVAERDGSLEAGK